MLTKIAVVIPTYNFAGGLERAISSALHQSRPPSEVIVVDDGSTDDTRSAVRQFGGSVRYVYQPNSGAAAARNRGVAESTAEWIAFLDHDDTWVREKLELQSRAIEEARGCAFSYTGLVSHREGASSVIVPPAPNQLMPRLRYSNVLGPTSTYMVMRTAFWAVGGFTEALRSSCEDWDLIMRLRGQCQFAIAPAPLTHYFDRTQSTSRKHALMFRSEMSIVESSLLLGLDGWPRKLARRRAHSCIYSRLAVGARTERLASLRNLGKSLALWPFPNLPGKRYRMLAVELRDALQKVLLSGTSTLT